LKWVWLWAALSGCSYKFDAQAPDITLLGAAPNTDGLPRLNQSPTTGDYLVLGYDDSGHQNAYWDAFTETIQTDSGPKNGLRAVRLSEPAKEEVILADEVTPAWTRFFLVNNDPQDPMAPPTLSVRSAGQSAPPITFQLPGAPGFFGIGYGDLAFLYWVAKPDQTTFFTFRSDGSFARELPIPPSVTDPTDPKMQFQWSYSSDYLVIRDPEGGVMVHSTIDNVDHDLGVRPKLIGVYGDNLLLACGDSGLRTVQLDGTHETLLDPLPCDEHGDLEVQFIEMKNWIYYGANSELWRVLLDGSGMPEVVLQDGLRPLQFIDDGRIMFSKTAADLYVNAAGDGWLGGWRFMQRGIDAGISYDKSRVRWLEGAAKPNGAGELLSAPIGQEPLHLTLNTRQWEELGDGRVLADADHAFRGSQNRIVVVDEKSRTAKWVAASAAQYTHIPGTNDLLIDVVTGPTGYDIVRVPIPPPDPPPDAGTD
jgi:hypothetical protein